MSVLSSDVDLGARGMIYWVSGSELKYPGLEDDFRRCDEKGFRENFLALGSGLERVLICKEDWFGY
jgi:hypothetical protein